ncbi:MAG TPA: phosphate ABC transporter, permease protein PstA, partial [Gammaproteobacteria bacterium]|nr:phosphate ABC transporter, permease protein PstA [Gammaproteobacteria bacterium]
PALITPEGQMDQNTLIHGDYSGIIKQSLRDAFPNVSGRQDKRKLYSIVSNGASHTLRKKVLAHPELIGKKQSVWVLADDEIDMLIKGHISRDIPEEDRRLKDNQIQWVDQLMADGRIEKRFNTTFFTSGDSRDPEMAGILGA